MSPATGIPLKETTENGSRTRRWVVEAGDCVSLATHRISRLGYDETLPPYKRVRMTPAGSFLLACHAGAGAVLLDGRWVTVGPGTVCLAPPRVLNAFYTLGDAPWSFGWIRYEEPLFVAPVVGADSPVLIRQGAEPFLHSMKGFRGEWEGKAEPAFLHHWLELIHGQVRRLSQPWWQSEPRVARLWNTVSADLSKDWTLAELAHLCHCSPEHLRRLCLRQLGRSPMQHLTRLRMEEARQLLERTDDKMEVIAAGVGYANGAIFSRVFKRWVGVSPGEYRRG